MKLKDPASVEASQASFHQECEVILTRSKITEGLVGDELMEGVVEDVSDDKEGVGEREVAKNKEKKK